MEPYSMSRLRELAESATETEIKRGDGCDIKCIQDMAKYTLYLQDAREAAALPQFEAQLSSRFNPIWRWRASYKKCLGQVSEIAKLYSGKQAKVTPTALFEDGLGMSKDDVFVCVYHLDRVIEDCRVDLFDAIYSLRLRSCQDVADVICFQNSFYVQEDEADKKKQVEDMV